MNMLNRIFITLLICIFSNMHSMDQILFQHRRNPINSSTITLFDTLKTQYPNYTPRHIARFTLVYNGLSDDELQKISREERIKRMHSITPEQIDQLITADTIAKARLAKDTRLSVLSNALSLINISKAYPFSAGYEKETDDAISALLSRFPSEHQLNISPKSAKLKWLLALYMANPTVV